MDSKSRRKELTAQYRQTAPEAGVYRITNTHTGRSLVRGTANLASMRNKIAFGKATNSPVVLDRRLEKDVREFGIDAFDFEVLEVLETKPDATRAGIQRDLDALEELWREKLAGDPLY
ncbi:MAG: GIY-YIG nuclease family protein [Hyphomicrobiales bacterium]